MISFKGSNLAYDVKHNRSLFVMIAPTAILVLIFSYLPMGGLLIAFKNYNYRDGILGSPWVGLDNFRYFFISGKAFLVTWHTIFYNVLFFAAGNITALLLAIFISETGKKRYKQVIQSIVFLPNFVSWVVAAALIFNIFNFDYGIWNAAIEFMGGKRVDIYSNPDMWYFLLPLFKVWKTAGWGSVLYFAAISGIDQECYESAEIDGANVFQRVWHITLPMLVPTMVILGLLALGNIVYGDFDMFYQLIGKNGLLYDTTDIIDTFVFRSVMASQELGMVSAAGFYQSVVGFVIVFASNMLVRRVQPERALF